MLDVTLNHEDFTSAATWVGGFIPTKAPVGAVRGMKLHATQDGLHLTAFDYETSATTTVAAQVDGDGEIVVPGKLCTQIAANCPHAPVRITASDTTCRIHAGAARFETPLIPLEDYPALPETPPQSGEIDATEFSTAIRQVTLAASREDTIPMLTAVRLHIDANHLTLECTDRFRLATRTISWSPATPPAKPVSMHLPAKTLTTLARSFQDEPNGTVQIQMAGTCEEDDDRVGISLGNRRTTLRILDVNFPQTSQLFPEKHACAAIVDTEGLAAAIRRVAAVSTEPRPQIMCRFSGNQLHITTSTSEGNAGQETLGCQFSSDTEFTLTVARNYLLDGLTATNSPQVAMWFTRPNQPVIITPATGEETLSGDGLTRPATDAAYMVMPMRTP